MIDFGWCVFSMIFMGLSGLAFGLVTGFFLGVEQKLRK